DAVHLLRGQLIHLLTRVLGIDRLACNIADFPPWMPVRRGESASCRKEPGRSKPAIALGLAYSESGVTFRAHAAAGRDTEIEIRIKILLHAIAGVVVGVELRAAASAQVDV